jgi:SOS-response transcriptional repressor LexA
VAPTYREIAARLQVASSNTIHRHAVDLVKQGKLTRAPGKYRTLRLPRSII